MIEFTLTESELIWLFIIWAIGQFLAGVGKGLGKFWRKKIDSKDEME